MKAPRVQRYVSIILHRRGTPTQYIFFTVHVHARTGENSADTASCSGLPGRAGRRGRHRVSVRAVFGRLIQNSSVVKLIVLAVSLCLVYFVLRLAVDLLDVRTLASLGLFSVYVDGVSALVNATNSDIIATATDYNAVLMPSFAELVHAQISNLHQLVQHFNHGLSYTDFQSGFLLKSRWVGKKIG